MIKGELTIFLVIGTLTVLIDFSTYRGLVELGVISVDFAKGISFLVGTTFAYFANRMWTFGHNNHAPGSAWRFILLYAATLGANVGVNALMLHIFAKAAFAVQLAFLVATGISAVLNFLGMKWFVFKTSPMTELQ